MCDNRFKKNNTYDIDITEVGTMQGVNKKLVWSTAILALLLIAVICFFAGMYLGGKNNTDVPTAPVGQTNTPSGTTNNGSGSSGSDSSSGSGSSSSGTGTADGGSSGSGSGSSSGSDSGSEAPKEVLTPRQILDSSMYWADDAVTVGFMATAGGNFDVMIGEEVFHTTQILSFDDDTLDGWTYNMILILESYTDDHEASVPLYAHQMDYGKGVHIQMMTWDNKIVYLEPTDDNPLKKFAQ